MNSIFSPNPKRLGRNPKNTTPDLKFSETRYTKPDMEGIFSSIIIRKEYGCAQLIIFRLADVRINWNCVDGLIKRETTPTPASASALQIKMKPKFFQLLATLNKHEIKNSLDSQTLFREESETFSHKNTNLIHTLTLVNSVTSLKDNLFSEIKNHLGYCLTNKEAFENHKDCRILFNH